MISELITVRIQMGVENPSRFSEKVELDSTVAEIRQIIRAKHNISSSDGVVLIWNGQSLKNPDSSMSDLGICNDSLIICIVSKETGREIEELIGDDEEEAKYKDHYDEPEVVCKFVSRPFGFAVWPNEKGENAIVTMVEGESAREKGIKIGYCVYKVNAKTVFNSKHNDILEVLRNLECPIQVTFLDLALEYTILYTSKPLGFSVIQDRKGNNARVRKISKVKEGIETPQIGSYVTAVSGKTVFGERHKDIVKLINDVGFPVEVQFRHPPKLLSSKKTKDGLPKHMKDAGDRETETKGKRKLFKWFAGKSESKKESE